MNTYTCTVADRVCYCELCGGTINIDEKCGVRPDGDVICYWCAQTGWDNATLKLRGFWDEIV